MGKKGGRQPGSGRPKGSTTRPRLIDYYTKKELDEFMEGLKESAKTDNKIKIFVGEHLMGKAIQPIAGDVDNPLTIVTLFTVEQQRLIAQRIIRSPQELLTVPSEAVSIPEVVSIPEAVSIPEVVSDGRLSIAELRAANPIDPPVTEYIT